MALNLRSLLTRTLTAAVFVAVLLSAICWNYYSFTALFFVVSIWGLHEFFKISELLGAKPFKGLAFIASSTLYLSVFFGHIWFVFSPDFMTEISGEMISNFFVYVFVGMIFSIFAAGIFSKTDRPLEDIAYTIFAVLYCTIPFYLLNKLVQMRNWVLDPEANIDSGSYYDSSFVLGIIFLIWASDTFAYLVGSLIGRTKLNERISPGKTWEGTIGGGVLTMASSYIIAGWFPEIEFIHWLVISLLVVVFGTLGDLFESLLKRQAGIKDSGKIMPGHGGILDRFDSLIFVTPFVYLYLSWVLR